MAQNHSRNGEAFQAMGDASWLISYAMALDDQGKSDLAKSTWREAAGAEELAAFLLDAAGCDTEAGVHHASAATCYEKAGGFPSAVSQLHAALGSSIPESLKRRLRPQLKRCIQKAKKELQTTVRQRRKTAISV